MVQGTLPAFVDQANLLVVVRQILKNDSAEITECAHNLLYGGLGTAEGRNSIHRIAGLARVESDVVPWSVVLKRVAAPSSGAPAADLGHPDYWKREALTFASGLLNTLPEGFAAPACYSIDEAEDGVCLWLEDLVDTAGASWPLERFALAARHLGRFNGTYLDGRPLPNDAWLNQRLLRTRADRNAAFWSNLDVVRELPTFRRGWPDDLGERALRLFQERHVLLDLLEQLPQTLRHADAGRRNLFARDSGSTRETVAIDWAYTGVGPIGEEVAPLVVASAIWFNGVTPAELPELDAMAFEAYVEGLRETGWRGDRTLVRIGCAATTALRFGPLLGVVGLVTASPDQQPRIEQMFGRPLDDILDRYAQVQRFVFDRADEARRLSACL